MLYEYEKTIDLMTDDGKIIRVREKDLKLFADKLKDLLEIKDVSCKDLMKAFKK